MTHTAKLAAGMLTASFVGGGLASAIVSTRVDAQGANVVTAQQVNLVGRSGRLRGILTGEDERGLASLTLLDDTGQRRAALTTAADGTPALQLFDRDQNARVQVTIQNEQPIVLVGSGDERAVLSTVGAGPSLSFQSGQRVRAEVGTGAAGAPRVELFGTGGQRQLSFNVSAQNEPVITLRDDTGRSRASIGVVQGTSVINLADPMRTKLVLGVARDGTASLSLLDDTGKITSHVP